MNEKIDINTDNKCNNFDKDIKNKKREKVYLSDKEINEGEKYVCAKYGINRATYYRAKQKKLNGEEPYIWVGYHVKEINQDLEWAKSHEKELLDSVKIGVSKALSRLGGVLAEDIMKIIIEMIWSKKHIFV
jgi:hypothetical protein